MRDAYERFFTQGHITKKQFFEFGLSETIYPSLDSAKVRWEKLKAQIANNEPTFIRGFGQGGSKTVLYFELYKLLFKNSNISKDPTNNSEPRKVIESMTGYAKGKRGNSKPIRNYQVSHVFGRTKNIYAFTAPWNIVYTPKLLDPLTGHEAKGEYVKEYTELFQQQSFDKFQPLIEDYNHLVTNAGFCKNLKTSLDHMERTGQFTEKELQILSKSVEEEFKPIFLN